MGNYKSCWRAVRNKRTIPNVLFTSGHFDMKTQKDVFMWYENIEGKQKCPFLWKLGLGQLFISAAGSELSLRFPHKHSLYDLSRAVCCLVQKDFDTF